MSEAEGANVEAGVGAMTLDVGNAAPLAQPVEELSAEALVEAKAALNDIFDQIFTKQNIEMDDYLRSAISPNLTMPIEVVLQVPRVREVSTDPNVVRAVLAESSMVTLNNEVVKLNFKIEQNTVILRDIPTKTREEDVRAIFESVSNCPEITELRSDIGDTWYVTFNSEEDAKQALSGLPGCKFNDKAVKGRLKTESIKKSFYSPTYGGPNNGTPGAGGGPGPGGFFGEPGQMPVPPMPLPAGLCNQATTCRTSKMQQPQGLIWALGPSQRPRPRPTLRRRKAPWRTARFSPATTSLF